MKLVARWQVMIIKCIVKSLVQVAKPAKEQVVTHFQLDSSSSCHFKSKDQVAPEILAQSLPIPHDVVLRY